MENKFIITRVIGVLVAAVVVFFVFLPWTQTEPEPDPVEKFLSYEDVIIFPYGITGLSIQKYSVASETGDAWGYVLTVHGVSDIYIWFDDRPEAEDAMIQIAEWCGI